MPEKPCTQDANTKQHAQQPAADAEPAATEDSHAAPRKGKQFLKHPPKSYPVKLLRRLEVMVRMLVDYWAGRYKALPWLTVGVASLAVLYIASPIDLVPDFIPGLGLLDDAVVIGLVWFAIKRHLRAYCLWKGLDPAVYLG